MTARLLSPFTETYSKLHLHHKWWHRLSIVGLVLCVVVAFALTLVLRLWPDLQTYKAAMTPPPEAPAKTEHGPWEQYAQITNLPALPKDFSAVVLLSGRGERIQFPADTTKGELMKALCDHLKQGDAACWEVVSETPTRPPAAGNTDGGRAPVTPPAFWWVIARVIGISFAVSLAVDYLLQLAYRVLIFVAFGAATSEDATITP